MIVPRGLTNAGYADYKLSGIWSRSGALKSSQAVVEPDDDIVWMNQIGPYQVYRAIVVNILSQQ